MSDYIKNLDDWFVAYPKRVKPKRNNIHFKYQRSNQNTPFFKLGASIKNFHSASLKHPEVMVKIPKRNGVSNGLKGIRNHLDYISRNGEIELENKDGQIIHGKKEVKEMANDWKKLNIPEESKHREALNIVLSMPPGTDPEGLKNATREFAKIQFSNHEYVMAQHLDTKHPHVHLCVLMRDQYGRRINPRKKDLFEWRILFAEKLREEGIQCAATRRQHRGKTIKAENGVVRHIKDSGRVPYRHIQATESLIEALKENKRPTHPFLKEALETQGIILEEYGKISKELYKRGYKTEAKAVSTLSKMVQENTHTTKAQKDFDRISSSIGKSYHKELDH